MGLGKTPQRPTTSQSKLQVENVRGEVDEDTHAWSKSLTTVVIHHYGNLMTLSLSSFCLMSVLFLNAVTNAGLHN